MTKEEIIGGLQFTVDMFLFDPNTGETYTEPRNDMDKTTIDACKGAIELLEQTRWIPVSERLPEIDEDGYSSYVLVSFSNFTLPCIGQLRKTDGENHWYEGDDEKALDSFGLHVNAWMQLPKPYREESEDKE